MNPSWTGTSERELQRSKGSCTLESHLLDGKINQTRGIPRCREECSSKSEYGKTDQEPNGPSELWAQSPKIETPGWGLGTKYSAPEVSPWERARGRLGGGWAPRPPLQRLVPGLGGRGRAETAWEVSKPFDGAETAWETRKQNCHRGREQYSRSGEVESCIRGNL